jgi:acetyl esterase/lipase
MPVLHRLDPAYPPILRQVPVIDLTDLAAARAAILAMYAQVGSSPVDPDIAISDHSAPGLSGSPDVKLRMFRPQGETGKLACLYWIQGGGYVLPAPDLDDQICGDIAKTLPCAVISVQWRRAPEAPFPAASDDCFAGLQWAVTNAESLGLDTTRLVVGGASSGGGAAASLAIRVRDQAEFPIAHQVLIYPMLDDRNTTPSSKDVTDPELWNRQDNEIAWRAYLGETYGTPNVSPYAAPARMEHLEGLAPATILTGEFDLFRDENIEYAQRLMHAGINTELHVYPAVHHGFDRHDPTTVVSKRFFADRNAALRRAFAL